MVTFSYNFFHLFDERKLNFMLAVMQNFIIEEKSRCVNILSKPDHFRMLLKLFMELNSRANKKILETYNQKIMNYDYFFW